MISYDKLWQTMKEKGVTQYTLIKKYNVEDIMQYIDDEEI